MIITSQKAHEFCAKIGIIVAQCNLMKFSISYITTGLLALAFANVVLAQSGSVIHKTSDYTIFSDGVKQGRFSARALSPTALISDYQSPKNETVSSRIEFKFSINGKDNEMKPGVKNTSKALLSQSFNLSKMGT